MDYDIPLRTMFSRQSEYKNLYTWFFQEYDESGQEVGSAQIPWDWGLYFYATQITYSHSIKKDVDWSKQKGDERPDPSVTAGETIYAKLQPDRTDRRATVKYSFFGTNRAITDISLRVLLTEGEEEGSIWGSPSYTSDWDFEDVTQPDCLVVTICLQRAKFEQLRDLVTRNPKPQVSLRLRGVEGFYSEWSPSIRTNDVKILANVKDQKIEIPDDLEFEPPRLGTVDEFDLSYVTSNDCTVPKGKKWFEPDDESDDELDIRVDAATDPSMPPASEKAGSRSFPLTSSGGIIGIADVRSNRLYRLLGFPLFLLVVAISMVIPIASVAYAFSLSTELWIRIAASIGIMELAMIVLQIIGKAIDYVFGKVFFFLVDPVPTEGRTPEQALLVAKLGDSVRLALKMNHPNTWTDFDTERMVQTNGLIARVFYGQNIRDNIRKIVLSLRKAEAEGIDLVNDQYEVQRRVNALSLAQSWHQKLFMNRYITLALFRYVIFVGTLVYLFNS